MEMIKDRIERIFRRNFVSTEKDAVGQLITVYLNGEIIDKLVELFQSQLIKKVKESLGRVRLEKDTIFPGPRDVDGAASGGYNQAVFDLNREIDTELKRLEVRK